MITLSTLTEWRRTELENPDLQRPPANLLAELHPYLRQIQEEAGPNPSQWAEDCEPITARATLEDIFRLRRAKIAGIGESLTPEALESMIGFLTVPEANTLTRISLAFSDLDTANNQICRTGEWLWKEVR